MLFVAHSANTARSHSPKECYDRRQALVQCASSVVCTLGLNGTVARVDNYLWILSCEIQ